MRTFAIIVGTIVVCLLIGAGGFWLGSGGLARSDVIMASVNERGDLEITSLKPHTIDIYGVTFNDRYETGVCTSRPNPVFWARDWRLNGMRGGWNVSYAPVRLREGDVVYALYNPRVCGERIMKAEIATSRGTYVYRYPRAERSFVGGPRRTSLSLDRWADVQ